MQLQARDKRALILGAIVVTLLLLYLLWPRQSAESEVELVSAAQRGGPAAVPIPAAPAQPVQPQPVPVVAAQPAAASAAVPDGLKLTGVTGASAIFSYADGSQRLVQRGREVAPGVTLQAVRLRDVIVTVGPSSFRLGLGGGVMPLQPAPVAVVPVAPAPPAPVAVPAAPATPTKGVPNANLMH